MKSALNTNKDMNKTTKIILSIISGLLLSAPLTIRAQCSKSEIIGKRNTYILTEVQGYYSIENKNNCLMYTKSSYLDFEVIPPISIENKKTLDEFVYKYLSPYFKLYSGTFKSYDTLDVGLFSDIKGNIKELVLIYPNTIGVIPAIIIDEFEHEVLNSNIKLVFNKNHRVFRGTNWVEQYAAYDAEKLRKDK